MSHEFQVLASTGESAVFYDIAFEEIDFLRDDLDVEQLKALYAATEEKHDPASCPVPKDRLRSGRGIEVGQIFYFGAKYSKPMGAVVMGPDGQEVPVEMGSYGIGVSRLVGALIEVHPRRRRDHLARAGGAVQARPDQPPAGRCRVLGPGRRPRGQAYPGRVEPLVDDRDENAGAKFAAMDLIGLPWQAVVGPRGVRQGVVELKHRASGERIELSPDALIERLTA